MSFLKYGQKWPDNSLALDVEFWNIRKGEAWLQTQGRSLFFHYKEAQKILWPEEDHHRWSDLILEEILKNDITILLGAKDSGKTRGMCKYGLTDYFCFPDNTLIIVSSTDIRSLEGRVWGDIKSMFAKARELHEWLPGIILDSKHALCTDDLEDDAVLARDMRKGLLCFAKSSLVDTPKGKVKIESLKVGDLVFNAIGVGRIKETFQRTADSIAEIITSDDRILTCTPEHKVFTNHGWIKACNLTRFHYMLSVYEAMQILQNENQEQSLLFSELQREVDDDSRGKVGVLHTGTRKENSRREKEVASRQSGTIPFCGSQDEVADSNSGILATKQSVESTFGIRVEASNSRRKRLWPNQGRAVIDEYVPSSRQKQLPRGNGKETWQRVSDELQSGYCVSRMEAGNRGRRELSHNFRTSGTGCQENQLAHGAWVDSVEIFQPKNPEGQPECEGGIEVYNLEVSGHPSYVINGILVHNCIPCKTSSGGQTNISAYVGMKQQRKRYLADEFQFMSQSMYDSLGNANSGNFKMVCAGNPIGQGDPLDIISEPKGGWETMSEPEKTTVWDNEKFLRSRSVNLVGTDSPNFDFPQDRRPRYWYLTNKDSIARTIAGYGQDSHQYYSQCKGVRRSGLNARRVITQELCRLFNAFDGCTWEGETIKVAAADIAYGYVGGDRCVAGHLEFGKCVDGKTRLFIHPQQMVPVSVRQTDSSPEDQIASWIRRYCESWDIPPQNFFYDSTGRGSLGPALARLWSAQVNPVEFGGTPTPRPVSLDTYTEDPKIGRRLKRCDEHYRKFVTELWWTSRLVIESDQMRGMSQDLCREGCMREWKEVAGGKIEIESKAETKERMGRSPDLYDQLVTAIEGARRLGFQITRLGNQTAKPKAPDWLDVQIKDYSEFKQSRELAIP